MMCSALLKRMCPFVRCLTICLLISILLIPSAGAIEQNCDNLYLQAMKYYNDKQYTDAFHVFQEQIRIDANHKEALFMLGLMYEKGEGVEENDYEASEMYRRSWKSGNLDAYKRLDQLYNKVFNSHDQKKADHIRSKMKSDGFEEPGETGKESPERISRIFMKLPLDMLSRYGIDVPKESAADEYEVIVSCEACPDIEEQAADIAEKLGATITYKDSCPACESSIRSILEGKRTETITVERKSYANFRDGRDDTVQLSIKLNCSGWCKVIQKVIETIAAVIEVTTRSTGREVEKTPEDRSLSGDIKTGKYYGLLIGINSYRDLPKLKNAVSDATVMDQVLRERYGFENKLLIEEQATRDNIMKSLNDLRRQLTENDSLIVFYSGHGEFNKKTDTSYWLPIDAGRDDNTKWLETRSISDQFKLISARHVLVIADSCFSGTMTRSADTRLSTGGTREKYLNKLFKKPSRVLIASGGNEPVTDAGGKGHSIFSDVLITALSNVQENVFTAEELMTRYVKEPVAGRTAQTPEYSIIRNSGHDGGDFIFRKINK